MKKAVIGLSGGMDSTTLLAVLLDNEYEVHCCNFQYGSKHNLYEKKAFNDVVAYYMRLYPGKVVVYNFDLTNVFQNFKSNLLKTGGEIPEGHYEEEQMKLTVVPGRNTIFASIMMGLAESLEAQHVILGVHAGDHHIYPDCRKQYIQAMQDVFIRATENKVLIMAPFIDKDKESILRTGYYWLENKVPYALTRTCYKEQELSCGKCGSCVERLEAFEKLGEGDPIQYE